MELKQRVFGKQGWVMKADAQFHISSLLLKLNASNRTEAVTEDILRGLITSPSHRS